MSQKPAAVAPVCGDRQLLFEEAPGAYKRIEHVIADLVHHRLATPVATTIPLVTYKTAERGSEPRQRQRRGRPGSGIRPRPDR